MIEPVHLANEIINFLQADPAQARAVGQILWAWRAEQLAPVKAQRNALLSTLRELTEAAEYSWPDRPCLRMAKEVIALCDH